LRGAVADVFQNRVDDGDGVDAAYQLIGRLFMSMLARLEREQLLSKDSEVPNLGLIMALYVAIGKLARPYGLLEESSQESLGPAKDKKTWEPHAFGNQILAYARKYEIHLAGPHDIDEMVAELDANVDLPVPESNSGAKADPFGFAKALKNYKSEHGCRGGDKLDITSWTSAERKAKSFSKKDPLGKKEIDALKQGMVMSLG
jgi:hypothetical protein